MRLGVALGSGGARGLAHVGVLSVLEQEGLTPFCIAGTSMGAIVGALYADQLDAQSVADRIRAYTEDPQFQATWEPFLEGETPQADRGFFQGLRRSIHRKILTFKTFTSPSLQTADPLLEPLQRVVVDVDPADVGGGLDLHRLVRRQSLEIGDVLRVLELLQRSDDLDDRHVQIQSG